MAAALVPCYFLLKNHLYIRERLGQCTYHRVMFIEFTAFHTLVDML